MNPTASLVFVSGTANPLVDDARSAEARALLARLAAGDRAPLGALYDLFSREIHALALWRTGRREDADDVLQDVFVKLATTGADLGRVREPRIYLLAMAHRAAIDRVRGRRETGPLVEAALVEASSLAPEHALDAARVSRALAVLPSPQRGAIYLHLFAELPFREVGRVTGVPTFTAASRYRLGMKRLHDLLGEKR